MAAPSPRVLETAPAAPRVGENNNNNNNNNNKCNQVPRVAVATTITTAFDQLRNRLATKSVQSSDWSSEVRTKAVQKQPDGDWSSGLRTKLSQIAEEILPHTTGTRIRKSFKKNHKTKSKHLNVIITSYDKDREYYMIEYEDGDSEELRHKTVEKYIVTVKNTETSQNCKSQKESNGNGIQCYQYY